MIGVSNSSAKTFKRTTSQCEWNLLSFEVNRLIQSKIQSKNSSSTNSPHSSSTIFEFLFSFFFNKFGTLSVFLFGKGSQMRCGHGRRKSIRVFLAVISGFMNYADRLLFVVALVNLFMLFCIEILFILRF